jgi:hypothetical protein
MPVGALLAAHLAAAALAGDPCVAPDALQKEAEGCGAHTNNGCNSFGHPTEPIEFGVPIAGSFWANSQVRDTDFYRFVIDRPTAVRVRVWASVMTQLAIAQNCWSYGNEVGPCADLRLCLPPGTFNVFVAPLASYPVCGTESSSYTVLLELDPESQAACQPLVGDIDGDGRVNGVDIGYLLNKWGSNDPGLADISGDGVVDGRDLGLLLGAWTG